MKTHKTNTKTQMEKNNKKAEDTSYTFEVNSFKFCTCSLIWQL